MKRFLFILWTIAASGSLYAQYFPVDTARLNSSYRNLMEHPESPACQKAYFESFPSTWMEYIMTYQYMPEPGYDLAMYYEGSKQVEAFGNRLPLIADSVYFKKLVNLGSGALKTADAPNHLQSLLKQKMKEKPDALFQSLSQFSDGERMLFWTFYWSNNIYKRNLEKDFNETIALYEQKYPVDVEMMRIAYKYFHKDTDFVNQYPHKDKDKADNGNVSDVEVIKSFYSAYITHLLNNNDSANAALKEECLDSELLKKLGVMTENMGADPIINGQDADEEMLRTLKVSAFANPDWYVVSYYWDNKSKEVRIFVTLTRKKDKALIKDVLPML